MVRSVLIGFRNGDFSEDSRLWELLPTGINLGMAAVVALLVVLFMESRGDPAGKNASGRAVATRTITYLFAGISCDSIIDTILGGLL